MAKSVRASVSKRNRANLRKSFFGPVVDARTERLATKLQELADQPRPEKKAMEVESSAAEQDGKTAATSEDMDVDTKPSSSTRSHKSGRVQKQRNRKPRNSMVFKPKTSGKDKKGSKRK
ncbi:hypothetical protein N7481_012747 [Penicillium waksmanii]|uniref:uncharacterized protein n=1 Tax=Penicillium waksmanii TaxID=69791 RepID=UPI0025494C1E|nr:uncharacterized protein N7481_012747 [Penicillium waksmanii]KAJ5966033.1 hypothetical protein N7481_012747 [Penicillium waksmanii]